jgi:hypothetical protein
MRRTVYGLIAALSVFGVTLAAAPRTSSPATIALNVPSSQVTAFTGTSGSATIYPSLGDSVTFSVTYPKTVEKFGPRIQVLCYQNGTLVYGEAGPYYQAFLLGGASSNWLNNSPGPANCVADLYYWSYQGGQKFNWLASVEFEAGGGE